MDSYSCMFFLHTFTVFVTSVELNPLSEGTMQLVPDRETATLSRLIYEVSKHSSTVILIHDDADEYRALAVSGIVNDKQRLVVYQHQAFPGFLNHHINWLLNNASLSDFSQHLSFIVTGGTECVQTIMNTATEIDRTMGQALLRHFSTWLIISPNPPAHQNITLDNVAVVTLQTWDELSFKNLTDFKLYLSRKRKFWNHQPSAIYTLLWMPGGREWLPLCIADLLHDSVHALVFPNLFRGLNGRQLVLIALEWLPHTKRHIINGELAYTGAGIDVVDSLAMIFNFSYKVEEPSDMVWGHEETDGNWTGVVGVLQRKEADMCPVPYGISEPRTKVMDLSYPVAISDISAVYIRKLKVDNSWNMLLSCFSWNVYMCWSVAGVWIVLFMICLTFYQEHKTCNRSTLETQEVLSASLGLSIRISLRQDIIQHHVHHADRIIIITWCTFGMVIFAVYTGNLVALATKKKYQIPFTTLRELAENQEYAVGATDGGYGVELLRKTSERTHELLYEKILTSAGENKVGLEDHIGRLLETKYVLLAAADIIGVIKNRTCDMVVMKESLFQMSKGFAFPRNSPLKKLFHQKLAELVDSGIVSRSAKKWRPKPKVCGLTDHTPRFKTDHFKIVLVTCATGILVGTLILCIEMWKKKRVCCTLKG